MNKYYIYILVILIIVLSAIVLQKYHAESGWKTFVNKEYSFSVQYPKEFSPEYSSKDAELNFRSTKNIDPMNQTPVRIFIGTIQPENKDKINQSYTADFQKDISTKKAQATIYRQKNQFSFFCDGIDVNICEKIIRSAKFNI